MKRLGVIILTLALSLTTMLFPVTASEQQDESQIKAVIEQFYNLAYDSWWDLQIEEFDEVLDLTSIQSKNFVTALKENIFKWTYSINNGFYEGERERHNIHFDFKTVAVLDNNTAKVEVFLSGEEEGMPAYPAFVCFGENVFMLTKNNGMWKISRHEYTDCDLFEKSFDEIITFDESALTEELEADYSTVVPDRQFVATENELDPKAAPYTDYSYSANRAVKYAKKFVTNPNTSYFYYYSSGDCTNFVSQCVSYGFGNTTGYSLSSSYRMVNTGNTSTGWFAGSGGGSSPWESVMKHWKYMKSAKTGLAGPRVSSPTYANMVKGDIMQIDFNSDGTYDHSVICVDRTNQIFAQHTSNGYRYYTAYSGTKRYYHPKFFREY